MTTVSIAGYLLRDPCPDNLEVSPELYWFLSVNLNIVISGVGQEFNACILEGKPVPTFPRRLCQPRKADTPRRLTGLQFTSKLGEALALLEKHGLDTERRKEFPVEVALESLLSTSPLMVATAPDMDVTGCVEHFLQHCADKGEMAEKFAQMPVGDLIRLRGGWNQHVLTAADIPELRSTAQKCMQVRAWA